MKKTKVAGSSILIQVGIHCLLKRNERLEPWKERDDFEERHRKFDGDTRTCYGQIIRANFRVIQLKQNTGIDKKLLIEKTKLQLS